MDISEVFGLLPTAALHHSGRGYLLLGSDMSEKQQIVMSVPSSKSVQQCSEITPQNRPFQLEKRGLY